MNGDRSHVAAPSEDTKRSSASRSAAPSRSPLAALGCVAGATLLVFSAVFEHPRSVEALPNFSEAYGVKCSLCHTIAPQLNSYGRYLQRTAYAPLDRATLKKSLPLSLGEDANYDTQAGFEPHHLQTGNVALHAAGFAGSDFTYHIHQWIVHGDQSGGVDTVQLAYNKLFSGSGHLIVGKFSAFPVPGPFILTSDISGFATAGLQVGEHTYEFSSGRWGAEFSYAKPKGFVQVGWLGSSADLSGASDFSPNNDKTIGWTAGLTNAAHGLEFGAFGTIGSWPLTEGGVDHYQTVAAYLQRDPGPATPGFFGVYQVGHDAAALPGISANSHATTLEVFEPLFSSRALVGVREEFSTDGLGTVSHSGNIDFSLIPFRGYEGLRLYLESGLAGGSTPAWRAGLSWIASPRAR